MNRVMNLSGNINYTQLAKHFKKSHRRDAIWTHRDQTYLTMFDKFVLVRASITHEVTPWWGMQDGSFIFHQNSLVPETAIDERVSKKWDAYTKIEPIAKLKVTRHLYELPGSRSTSSNYYRKLTWEDAEGEHHEIWVDREYLDIFESDPDRLDYEFLIELIDEKKAVRIAGRYGWLGMVAAYRPEAR